MPHRKYGRTRLGFRTRSRPGSGPVRGCGCRGGTTSSTGDLTAAAAFLPEKGQSANLWWPDDRSWCVASEIDLPWTYLAGPVELIDQVLRDQRLEALPAHPDDPCTLQVPDWLKARLETAVDELVTSHTAVVTTSRGVARASMHPPTRR